MDGFDWKLRSPTGCMRSNLLQVGMQRLQRVTAQLQPSRCKSLTPPKSSHPEPRRTSFQDPRAHEQSLRVPDLFSVRGKIALVTGGSRGIGFMVARGLVENGAKVYICSRKPENCAEAAKTLNGIGPGSAVPLPGDLGTEEGREAVAEELKSLERTLDILVNNAGATWAAPFQDYPAEAWDKVLQLNVVAAFSLTQKLLPLLARAAGHRSQGSRPEDAEESSGRPEPARVINMSSVAGIRPAFTTGPGAAFAYATSKAALNHLTRLLCRALSPFNITVNAIAPGFIPSDMTKFIFQDEQRSEFLSKLNPFERPGRTSDIAGAVLYLASNASSWLSGAVIPMDGGQHLHDT